MAAGVLSPENEQRFQSIIDLWRTKLVEAQDCKCSGPCHPETHLKDGVLQEKKLVSSLKYKI
jgi:hypothetical protein